MVAVIKKHVDSCNAYVELFNKGVDNKYDGTVGRPKKHDENRLHKIIIPRESITSSKKELMPSLLFFLLHIR